MLHRRLWLEALAAATGLELTPAEELRARDERDHDWMYDAVLAQLRDVIVPRTSDPLAQARGKGIARIIKYLARVDVYGDFYDDVRARRPRGIARRDARSRWRRGGRRLPRPWQRAPSATRTTCARCGAGWPARPSWPARRWGCWPTGTGRNFDER